MKSSKLIFGVGINDADYVTQKFVNGKLTWTCPFYQKWKNMLRRCYSERCQTRNPTYNGCSVCEEWLTFSNFKAWMEQQDWENKHLDKDLLVKGNKVYSPDTCVFLTEKVNSFLTDRAASRGEYPIGVSFYKPSGKYRAECCNPYSKSRHLGYFDDPNVAHDVWRKAKHEIALKLAKEQTDYRIIHALISRFKQEEVNE